MSYTIYHSTHVSYGNSIKYLIMTLSDISFTKSWQLYSLIIIAIKADNYIHSLMIETHFSYTKYLTKCDNIVLFHTLVSLYNYCSPICIQKYFIVWIVSLYHNVNLLVLSLYNWSEVIPSLLVFVYCNPFLSIYETISIMT